MIPIKIGSPINLRTNVIKCFTIICNNVEMNKFGGRFKYSKVNQLIDRIDDGITSNITKVIIRRDLKCLN